MAAVERAAIALLALLAGCSDYSSKPAAESIAAAVKAYERQHDRYPARLKDLVPHYLREIPKPESRHFVIGYGVETDFRQCWVIYQVHRDRVEEFDCNSGKWTNVEVDESHLFRRADAEYLRNEPTS